MTEVYAAGEEPIPGADGTAICKAVADLAATQPVFQSSVDEIPQALAGMVNNGDLVLTLGAGNIGSVAASMVSAPPVAQAGAGQ